MKHLKRFMIFSRTMGIIASLFDYFLLIYLHIKFKSIYITYVMVVVIAISVIFIFLSFCIHLKEYEYNGISISVYAGYQNYYLFVNNERVSAVQNQFFTSYVRLEYLFINDNLKVDEISVDIEFINKISLYVNKELIKNG